MSLDEFREEINRIDEALVRLLCDRARSALKIGREKQKSNIFVHDPAREDEVIANALKDNPGPLSDEALRTIFKAIIAACTAVQKQDGAVVGDEE